jgi:hypothetical protein
MIWREFETAAPELAALGRRRFEATNVALLGTLRRDGSPRISPVGPHLVLGHLLFGVMRSQKEADLARDSRCVLHSSVSQVNGSEGEFKLFGRALPVTDPALLGGDYEAWWKEYPPDRSSVFSLDIEAAVFIAWDAANGRYEATRWSASEGLLQRAESYP